MEKKLAEEHWSYIEALLDICMINESYSKEEVIKMIGFHYKTAMIHGWKHAKEATPTFWPLPNPEGGSIKIR